ncbi:hypothetical protein MLD38_021863 [Melastoma candidum]|uniref:Uncharacterized protein n=1 Tax=Melastoma candidum TaxID=119954 RepID=A0ACB9QHM8_9MYRT|nr:hypothetical protein MLD38_021863 [Melastoma candidum]
MFGGDPGNIGFPLFLEENNGFQYDSNALPQLQLFGNYPVGQNITPLNYVRKNEPNNVDRPVKRFRDAETITRQQIYPMTLKISDKCYRDEAGHSGSIFNPVAVSTGLKLSYEEDEHNSSVTSVSENATATLPAILSLGDSFKVEIDQQKKEMDLYIKAQEETLAKGLRELRQKQTVALLSTIEKGVLKKLQEKDLELEMMNCKNRELEERIKQVTNEVQTWHYRAQYNKSVVNILKNNLEQVMSHGAMQGKEGCGDSEVDDAASYANHNIPMDGVGDPRYGVNKMACKSCKMRRVEMLLLPCRHLCLCKECDAVMDVCPLCHVRKTATAQVYMS